MAINRIITNLGLGTAATVNTGTSGSAIPLLSEKNTFSQEQTLPKLRISGQSYPDMTLEITSAPDSTVGKTVLLETSYSESNDFVSVYLVKRIGTGWDKTGQVMINFPTSTGTIALQGTSGRDYKKNIALADAATALNRVLSLELVNFIYRDDEQERVRFGVIVEDAEIIAPQYIKHNPEPIPGTEVYDEAGNKISEEYRDRPSVDNNPIVMDLLGCVQALQQQISDLQAQLQNNQRASHSGS
ncbi:tail fiber domain-containing protein [Escherichia coli]|uniref:tail fiber domain-containing protein n=1 Tax=Escherichia coli TaxID=562 RepID=UPI00292AF607|nr:tail fiber domain-containing protein [Escherichia coli]